MGQAPFLIPLFLKLFQATFNNFESPTWLNANNIGNEPI